MAFQKNWTQFIVSKGEPFQIDYLDRKFRGTKRTVFKVDEDGNVLVNGHIMDGSQNIAGDLAVSDDVSVGGDTELDGDLAVGGTLDVTGATTVDALTAGNTATDDLDAGGDATVAGTLDVTGDTTLTTLEVATLAKLPAASFQSAVVTAEDASGGAQSQALVGANIGDLVIAVINITDGTNAVASYETAITVDDEIQQTATDLTGKKIFVLLAKQS